jgi:hypothetical protein
MGHCAVLVKHYRYAGYRKGTAYTRKYAVTAYPAVEDAVKRKTQQMQGVFRMLTLEHRVWEVAVSHLDLYIGLADSV